MFLEGNRSRFWWQFVPNLSPNPQKSISKWIQDPQVFKDTNVLATIWTDVYKMIHQTSIYSAIFPSDGCSAVFKKPGLLCLRILSVKVVEFRADYKTLYGIKEVELTWLCVIILIFSFLSFKQLRNSSTCWTIKKMVKSSLKTSKQIPSKGYTEKTELLRHRRWNRWLNQRRTFFSRENRWRKTGKLRDRRWGWREWEIKGNSGRCQAAG